MEEFILDQYGDTVFGSGSAGELCAGGVLSAAIALIAKGIAILPGANVVAEVISSMGIVLHILIMIVMMIYFWTKYEDKTIIKNFKTAAKDLFRTVKSRDYSKDKEIVKEYSTKIKDITVDTTGKIKENISAKIHKKDEVEETEFFTMTEDESEIVHNDEELLPMESELEISDGTNKE